MAFWRAELLKVVADLKQRQPLDAHLTSWAAVNRAAGLDAFAAAPSSANLRALLTDETGTGAAVFAGAPTITGIPIFSGIPSLAGGALSFPATQVPSAGANDLDDYEEGTFTPLLTFGGGSTGITYTRNGGWYTKTGNLVVGGFEILLSAKGSSTGTALISIPFTSAITASHYAANVIWFQSMTGLTGALQGLIPNAATTMQVGQTAATGVSQISDTSFTSTSRLGGSFAYHV
jgi:hypothetical protein